MSPAPKSRWNFAAAKALSASAAVLLVGSLAACGPSTSGLQQDAASQLQQRVLGVTQAASANDVIGGLAALDSLEADLAVAVGKSQVSEDRRREITTAAAAVRADLTAAKEAADAAAAKAAEDAAAAQRQAEADATTAAAAADAANNVPAPAPAPAPGKGNEGKGKGKDG